MTDLKRVPMPVTGRSKYREIAYQILAAYRDGDAVVLPPSMERRSAEIKQQISKIIHTQTGHWPSFRLQTQVEDGGDRLAYIMAFGEDAELIKGRANCAGCGSPSPTGCACG